MKHFLILFALALCTPFVHGAESARRPFNAEATRKLEQAAQRGDRASAATAIDDGADVDAQGEIDWTPLHWAAYNGHQAIVALLIDKGATIDAKDRSERTPLHYVGIEAIAALLIDNGADINAQDWKGRTPLHYAATRSAD